jgi:hypothetical protein
MAGKEHPMKFALAGIVFCGALAFSQPLAAVSSLSSVHKVFIAQMPNGLDTWLRAEFTRKLRGDVDVVFRKEDADATITADENEHLRMEFRAGGGYGQRGIQPDRRLIPAALQSYDFERQTAVRYVEQFMRDRGMR